MSSERLISTNPIELLDNICFEVRMIVYEYLMAYQSKGIEYLTRQQVSDLLDIDLSTVNNWCKSGLLKPLGKGKRVYFRRDEIDESMVRLNAISE